MDIYYNIYIFMHTHTHICFGCFDGSFVSVPCLSPPLHVNDFAPSDGLEIHATFVQEFCQGAVFRRRVEIVMRVFFCGTQGD